jgi:hypothetical protein
MAFSGPWFIDGGSKRHPAYLARHQTYLATLGTEGVLGALDLRAQELATPGAAIRLAPGGLVIPNRAAPYESYSDKSDTEIEVPIDPTDSTGGRSDLVIVRVENPWESGGGWTEPADPANDPYIFARVVPNVSATLTDVHAHNSVWSAANVCRVDIPASTATITDAMIVDLRSLAEIGGQRNPEPSTTPPPIAEQLWTEASKTTVTADDLPSTQTTFVNWPDAANWTVPIPAWAQGADVLVIVCNPEQHDGHVWGETRLNIGGNVGVPSTFDMDAISTTAPNRLPVFTSGTYEIPASARGKLVNVKLEARQYADAATTGLLRAQTQTYTYASLNFKRYPSYV